MFALFKNVWVQTSGFNERHRIIPVTKSEYSKPPKDEYVRQLKALSPEEFMDDYNPGPVKPDGTPNFECHCVSHLVASPCGYAFRKALTCQKSASEEQLDKGACADEFVEFIQCAIKTQCFRRLDDAHPSTKQGGNDDDDQP